MYDLSEESSISQRVRELLDKNPLLTAKPLCKLLGLDYEKYEHHVGNIRCRWKRSFKNSLGLKGLTGEHFKNWRGWVYVQKILDRKDAEVTKRAIEAGWNLSKARNRYLYWKDSKLGRLEWFETGRVKIWIRKPADRGKINKLLTQSFLWTGLIRDFNLFEALLRSVRFKGATLLIPTSVKLPYLKIDLFKESNGFGFKMGDASHPTYIELNLFYPDWGEHSEAAIARFTKLLENLTPPQPTSKLDNTRMVA